MKYELAIAHRVCPALAKTASHFSDKLEMVRAATASLANAIRGIKTRLVVILDGCPAEYKRLFDDSFASANCDIDYECIETPAIGNAATYAKQMEILSGLAEDTKHLYFSEDDYIYTPNAFRAMIEFLSHDGVDFVTPLDHPDRYSHIVPESRRVEVSVSEFCHWREVGTTCCTFMCKSETFAKAKRQLEAYGKGSSDGALWLGITKDNIYNPSSTILAALRYLAGRRRENDTTGLEFTTLAAWRYHRLNLLTYPRFRLWGQYHLSPFIFASHPYRRFLVNCCKRRTMLEQVKTYDIRLLFVFQ